MQYIIRRPSGTFRMKSRKNVWHEFGPIRLTTYIRTAGSFVMLSTDVTKVPWHAWPTSEKQLRHQEEASEFCGGQEKLMWQQLPGASFLTAIKLFPKQKEAAILANKIRHINLSYFLYSFTAIFTINSLVSVSEAAHTWFTSLVK